MQSKNTIYGKTTLVYIEGIFTNASLEQDRREDNSVLYRRYIHKCNQGTQFKGRHICGKQKVYIHKCNLRTRYKERQLCVIQKVYSQMQFKNKK